MDTCDNCGAAIGKLETSFVWKGHTVCAACFAKLKQSASLGDEVIPYATPNRPAVPRMYWIIGGIAAVVLLVLIGGMMFEVRRTTVYLPASPTTVLPAPPVAPSPQFMPLPPTSQMQDRLDAAARKLEEQQRIAESQLAMQFSGGIDSLQTDGHFDGGILDCLIVSRVNPRSPAEDYGLRRGDRIVSVDGVKVGEISGNDAEVAKAMVIQKGVQAGAPIDVIRDGKRVTLTPVLRGNAQPVRIPTH